MRRRRAAPGIRWLLLLDVVCDSQSLHEAKGVSQAYPTGLIGNGARATKDAGEKAARSTWQFIGEGRNPVAVIDPDGLFGGDRLRRCSNVAQLHWPRLFLASDGFARLEINYAKIVGRAYPTFHPIPSEEELESWIKEYVENHLLFLYRAGGQLWGQWDTRKELLPRYKTAQDRRSPIPPDAALTQWTIEYRKQNKAFPKCFDNFSESFLHGVGVGVGVGGGKNICASGDAQVSIAIESTRADEPQVGDGVRQKRKAADGFDGVHSWFEEWWTIYWRKRDRKKAEAAFKKQVRTQDRFDCVMKATKAQAHEMLRTDEKYRPYGASWLNGERWDDEASSPVTKGDDYPELE